MLREEINKALDIFDSYGINEEQQMHLICYGIEFIFTYGDSDIRNRNRHYNVFEFANFLEKCKKLNIDLDIEYLLSHPSDEKYEELIHAIESLDKYTRKLEK